MTPVILADDLSGAMEVAAVFHRKGWRALLPFTTAPSHSAPGTLQVISTETRNTPHADARRILSGILAALPASDCGLLFKKIDSTMRGPAGAELAALCDTLPGRPVFLTPANPVVGRTVRDGILHVNGVRVTATAFRNDPACPVLHDDLDTLVTTSGGATIKTIALPLATLRSDTTDCAAFIREKYSAHRTVFLCDAETGADLDALVQAAHLAHEQPVLVGSGALAASIAAVMPAKSAPESETRHLQNPRVLFACGSMHPLSHRQMERLGIPLHTLPFATDAARPVLQNIAAELALANRAAFVLEPGMPVTAAQWLENTTHAVAEIHAHQPFGALFVTGGETARSVCQRLGGTALELVGEIEQGVAAARLATPSGEILVVTKPGGFGDDQTLIRVERWLATRARD